MAPIRWLLVFTIVTVLALVILYIRNHVAAPPRLVAHPQIPSSRPEIAPPLRLEAETPVPPPKPVFAASISTGSAGNELLRMVRPQYTKAAMDAHYGGQVKVNFVIGTDGMAHNIEVVNSPGYGMDRNIIEAIKQWAWNSVFIQEDKKVTITIDFKLDY